MTAMTESQVVKRVIIWKGHHEDRVFDVSTEALKTASLLLMFQLMDEEGYYIGMEETLEEQISEPPLFKRTLEYLIALGAQSDYAKAKEGDVKAAERFLLSRRDYEDESWYEYNVEG